MGVRPTPRKYHVGLSLTPELFAGVKKIVRRKTSVTGGELGALLFSNLFHIKKILSAEN